jgi:hypothetical protein
MKKLLLAVPAVVLFVLGCGQAVGVELLAETAARTSAESSALSRITVERACTSRPVQPSASVSTCSSPSLAQTMRATIGTG